MLPYFAVNLITKYILVPAVVVTVGVGSLAIPKHYNYSTHPMGNFKNYHYTAKVFDHPTVSGISNSRVTEIKVWDKNNNLVMDFYKTWRVYPTDPDLINLIVELDKEREESHKKQEATVR